MLDEEVRRGVKNLRESMKGKDGLPLTQVEFAPILRVGLSTLQRYEQLVPPRKGTVLARLMQLSTDAGRDDLAEMFHAALIKTVGKSVLLQMMPKNIRDVKMDEELSLENVRVPIRSSIQDLRTVINDLNQIDDPASETRAGVVNRLRKIEKGLTEIEKWFGTKIVLSKPGPDVEVSVRNLRAKK